MTLDEFTHESTSPQMPTQFTLPHLYPRCPHETHSRLHSSGALTPSLPRCVAAVCIPQYIAHSPAAFLELAAALMLKCDPRFYSLL